MDESWMEDIIIRREGSTWFFEGIDDEPLSRRQLLKLLIHSCQINIEEIAFMDLEFQENPDYTRALFGISGFFLYCE